MKWAGTIYCQQQSQNTPHVRYFHPHKTMQILFELDELNEFCQTFYEEKPRLQLCWICDGNLTLRIHLDIDKGTFFS